MRFQRNEMAAASTSPRGIAKRQTPRPLGAIIFLVDVLMIATGFAVTKLFSALLVHIGFFLDLDVQFHHFDTRRYYYVFLSFCILVRFAAKGHYSRRPPWLLQVEGILKTVAFAAIFDSFNFYFLDNNGLLPQMILFNWAMCALFLVGGRYASLFVIGHFKSWKLPIVLVGDARTIMDSFYAFYSDGYTGYEVKTVLLTASDDPDFDLSFLPKAHPHVNLYKDPESFDTFIYNNRGHYYIFNMDDLRGPYGERLVRALNMSQVEYGVIPHTRTIDVHGMEPHYFFGNDIMILHRRDRIRSPSGRISKRLLDIVVSAVAVIVLGILTAVVWASKKIEKSDTPLFYGGERVGMDGKMFNCWKFCTMRKDADQILETMLAKDPAMRAEWNKFQKLKNDPRVDTKISKLLRKTSLDELPQLWNVFVGDMSLVGPRPILASQKPDYGDMIEQYYAVRPGLTGLWQVSGRNETSFQQRVYWDGWYIRNWSLWYDIVIIFKTVKVLITGSGAY
jgi:Undecaprenyl-phosphate galactose phosphotransferase WbaP